MLIEQDALFESLYRDNFNSLKLYAFGQLHNAFEADEVVQETFCTALQKRDELQACINPKGYLMEMLKFKIREQKRARARYLKVFLAVDGNFPLEAMASPPVPCSMDHILNTAHETLNKEEWYIFQKFILNGFTHLEIAKELGITVPASQKRLERIRKKLEDVLPEH